MEWISHIEEIEVPVAGDYKMAFIWRNDNSYGDNPPAAIDNISISQVSCLMPTELSHIGISSSSVTLNWTVNGTEEAWEIEYRAEGESEWQMVTVYENPYILEGLNENTTYELRIRAVCSGATTTTQPITFTTDCVAFEITEENPLYEDFEGYTGTPFPYTEEGEIPTCWRNYSESPVLPHIITCSGDNNYAHSGTNTLYFYGAGDRNSYVALPKISNNLNGLFISFWVQASPHGTLSLGYISNDDDDFSTFEQITTIDNPNQMVFFDDPNNSMVLRGVYLNDIPTTADRLAFKWHCAYSSSRFGCCIDDVEISMITTNIFNGTVSNDWNTAANWSANSVPTATDNVVINADAIISTEAEANNVFVTASGSLTIADGGQLQHNNIGVQATTQRTISTYTGEKDNYYLIASPMTNDLIVSDETQTNLIANDYDLYIFEQCEDLEWRNYKNDEFTYISNGTGYLYANSGEEGQTSYTINFSGELKPSNADMSVSIYHYPGNTFAGWNLVGNPFACNAYIDQDFYRLGEGAVDATPASGAIAPMEGIFVKNTGSWILTFSRNEPEESGNRGALDVNVMSKGNRVDLTRVRFGEGQGLEKFQLNPNHTKVFIPQNGKDYAVTYSETNAGEMPLSFKAEENGSYTLEFSNEEITFDDLHLIDNMTGADVDLLSTPSYSFEARTTDYASRFKLVFATGNNSNEDNFAFFSNGSFVINNEGNATLQVVDVMGRIIKAENINGCTNVNVDAASGVYMLRLVNGNNVKVQKVVVK